ncbi:MAG: hypothetical protein LBL24_10165, partial [Bacteroidales bacterium]|nr:hypothetical protein [Bacteroidales bacterium]
CARLFYQPSCDAGRRLIWITPDKPQAQPGVGADAPLPSELRSSSTRYGVAGALSSAIPRVARRLHGVINIGCLPASDRKHETFRVYFARQGIHSNRNQCGKHSPISVGDS